MGRVGADLVFETLVEARLVVSCQTKWNPSDAEWDRWLSAVRHLEHQVSALRLLVVTAGGHPTKPQIERLRAVNKKNPPTAIVSSSLALRFMGSALTFVNPTIRCFPPSSFDAAFDHLGLLPAERQQAQAAIQQLQNKLGALQPSVSGPP
jgi:hypothetical protein